jgi:hypothetical protein
MRKPKGMIRQRYGKGLKIFLTIAALCILTLPSVLVLADDGTIFRRNVSGTPEYETEHAGLRMLPLYVPPQTAAGEVLEGVDIINAEGTVVETREYVQPLIVHYVDGPVEVPEDSGGFPGHGERDAFAGVSLDGGLTWKSTNLSKSADNSSFKYRVKGQGWVEYPGDVGRSFISSDGNQVLVVWVSRYAGGGSPAYAMSDDERLAVATHLYDKGVIDDVEACTDGDLINTPCPYLEDHFGVSGSQGSSDLADEGYPTVGILPYAALWTARGVLMPPAAEGEPSNFVWFKPERLSSANRDANRPEAACAKGAGCVITWQEDPLGIRPGDGEGPGEGWAGAVAHHETDIWYSYIDWEDLPLVSGDAGYGSFYDETGDLATWILENDSGSPSAAIPMAMPVRVSDNTMCKVGDEESKPYCFVDFDANGTADFCASTVSVTLETPVSTETYDMCVAEDGRLMRGNTGSTRARLGLHGYSSQCLYDPADPEACPIDSAWFYTLYEESKGLGEDGEEVEVSDDPALKIDMGKNVWYHTFDMNTPEMVSQGLMMNQPAIYPDDWSDTSGLLAAYGELGYNMYQIDPDPVYETLAGLETTLLQSEIARRPSNLSQDWYDAGETGTVAFQTWKQGIIRRGGPADIMARRFVMPIDEGEEECHDEYEYCTDEYFELTTTYEYLTITQDCHWEEGWVDYEANPAYKPNKSCNVKPDQVKCYPYIDLDGDPTYEVGIYINEEICEDVETWETVDFCEAEDPMCYITETWNPVESCVEGPTCSVENTCEPVETCDTEDPDCHVEEVCTGGGTIDYTANPYDYANMVCEDAEGNSAWAFTDGLNPRYVKGLCAAPALNMSGNTILTSETCGDAAACLEAFPFNEYFDDKDMTDADPISKIYTWEMYGPGYDGVVPAENNLDDPSWENPYDMAKGHRGFMTGDMVMLLYAWTPNWNALTGGHDVVNLYIRRSFDGGVTWSTLPASFTHTDGITYSGDGTTTCEWMDPEGEETPVCVDYAAGQFEQARNVSQLLGSQVTVIDPRYGPTTRSITEASVTTASLPVGFTAPLYPDDTRDPSRYFIVYETGLNSAYDEGEATPLDLFYGRAVDWGDDYLVWQDIADTSACLPSADTEDEFDLTGFCNEFDALEGDKDNESGEAAIMGSPGGMFLQATWNQIDFTMDGVEILSDAIWRRVLFLDDYIPPLE